MKNTYCLIICNKILLQCKMIALLSFLLLTASCYSDTNRNNSTNPPAGCYQGNYTISSEADMRVFQPWSCINGSLMVRRTDILKLSLPNLVSVFGDMSISENLLLDSLEGLDGLLDISGSFSVTFNPSLTNLKGIESLKTVGDDFRISRNLSLMSLEGLKDLSSRRILIGGNDSLATLEGMTDISIEALYVSDNPSLVSLAGLNEVSFEGEGLAIVNNDTLSRFGEPGSLNFTRVNGLRIEQNDALIDFQGMDNLEVVDGEISIIGNQSLNSLNGLNKLSRVGHSLIVKFNDSLVNLSGLDSLSVIDSNLTIEHNDGLLDLTGLESLTTVGWNMVIAWNLELNSLAGIENLININGPYPFQVKNNLSLLQCLAFSVFEQISTLEEPCIHGNMPDDACVNTSLGCYQNGFY